MDQVTVSEAKLADLVGKVVATQMRIDQLEDAIRALRWNSTSASDTDSPIIVERAGFDALRALLKDGERKLPSTVDPEYGMGSNMEPNDFGPTLGEGPGAH